MNRSTAFTLIAAAGSLPLGVLAANLVSAAPRASAHLYRSTAHQVVCRANCPVLTIRSDRYKDPVESDLPSNILLGE